MDHIDDIFERTHIQHLRAFLLEELEATHIDHDSYEDRLEKAHRPVVHTAIELLDEQKNREAIYEAVDDYAYHVKEVYLEIGMQCGARIMAQLLGLK